MFTSRLSRSMFHRYVNKFENWDELSVRVDEWYLTYCPLLLSPGLNPVYRTLTLVPPVTLPSSYIGVLLPISNGLFPYYVTGHVKIYVKINVFKKSTGNSEINWTGDRKIEVEEEEKGFVRSVVTGKVIRNLYYS